MKSLYRRYRPVRLEEVVGQEQVTKPLANALKAGKISHAYLLVGPRGCGKTSVARILAHEVNGFKYDIEDDYVDIIEIDGASNRGIDNIRELREKVMIAPTVGKYKVYIIDEVHMLTKEAFNALLKTLEEPPQHAIFIMATTDVYKVPVTITSRAQTYTFKLASRQVIQDFLHQIAQKEKINITDEALEVIAKRGGGSFRDSLSLLDQISTLSGQQITREMVVKAMGLPQDEKLEELLEAYQAVDMTRLVQTLQELLGTGVKAETLAEELILHIVAKPQPELLTLLAKLPEVRAPFAEAKLLVALIQNAATEPQPAVTAKAVPEAKPQPTQPQPVPAQPVAKPAVMPATATSSPVVAPAPAVNFDWAQFLDRVKELNDAIYLQLTKVQHEVIGRELHIYPLKKIVKSILARDNNERILTQALEADLKIIIHEADEKPNKVQKDETLAKISDIMGGEVENDGGGNPF